MSQRPVLLFACFGVDRDAWLDALRSQGPDIDIRVWPDVGDVRDIAFVLAWNVPDGLWESLPALRIIFSLGAGVDKMLADPALPRDIPLVRMVDPGLVLGMREYVALQVLYHHRAMPLLLAQQAQGLWQQQRPPLAADRVVGVLGLGQLGEACCATLVQLGFAVRGWSRTPRAVAGVTTFAGRDGLDAMLAHTEILICLLPLTPETEGLLDRTLFDRLPRGAVVINVGRGGHLVEEDLLAALADGRIGGATLDVFRTEPLWAESPLWRTPGVVVTPHISALTQPRTAATTLIDNLRAHLAGAPLRNIVDRDRGY